MLGKASPFAKQLAGPFTFMAERKSVRRNPKRACLTLLEEANTRPRAVSCRPFFLRQMAQQSQEERRPVESRRGFQQPLHVHRLPTMRREKSRPLRRAEFEWRANFAELFSSCALHHL